jgi:quinol monooxygenase YgiN
MPECIALIRRFIKPERADEFKAWFASQPRVQAPGFIDKTLTVLDETLALPAGLTGFEVAGGAHCVTFLMIERWASVDAFKAYVPHASTSDQDQLEAMPRQRAVLTVV